MFCLAGVIRPRAVVALVVFGLSGATLVSAADPATPPPAEKKLNPEEQAQLDEAQKLNDKVVALYGQGKFQEAVPLAEKVLEIRKKVLGELHPAYADSLNNLAGLYDSQGDYARAEPLYKQALQIRKKVLGELHPAYANSLNNLAGL